jgi:serine/threonine-protein kinase
MRKLLAWLLLLVLSSGLAGLLALLLLDNLLMPYLVKVPSLKVPSLQGLTAAQAGRRLEQWGLKMALGDSLHHDSIPAGAVVDQAPAAGLRVKQGRRVTVHLSKGARYYQVPRIRQVSLREARLQLEANQLQVGNILYVSSSTLPEGAVIDQSPPPGTLLPRGSRVDLRVSNGPPAALKSVPDLKGLPIAAVEDTLHKYEMHLGQVASRVEAGPRAGTVLSQSPSAGTRVPRHTRVDLVVSAEPLPTLPDTLMPKEAP